MRLLLDTNVWSRLIDRGACEDFYRYAKSDEIEVVVAPATLLELLRTPDRSARRIRVRLVCRSRWTRLPTEAESEAAELVAEIRRLRPLWLRQEPDHQQLATLHNLWRHQIWNAARADTAAVVNAAASHAAPEKEALLREQREQQQSWRADRFLLSVDEVPRRLQEVVVAPQKAAEAWALARGWRPGTRVAPWRFQTLDVFFEALFVAPTRSQCTGEHTTYADWVGAYLNLEKLAAEQRRFGELLLYEVDPAVMSRSWLRWAIHFAQHASKIGKGNPVDAQHAPHLFEADLFITADKRLARILEVVRPSAPSPFAQTAYLDPRGHDLTTEIDHLVTDRTHRTDDLF
jgi:predicted nucleic acid-binding protein